MEPTRPARVGFRGDSGFGGDKPLKWPEGLLHLLWQGQGDSPLRGDLEGADGEDGEDRRGRVLPPAVGQLAHQVRSGGGGERDVWARLGTSGPGRPGLTLCLSSENTIRDHFRNGSSDFTIVESKTEGWHGSGQ